ncbi:MAG: thioredoxin family protein [Candidatus Micrarchaeaceae archaeon]
MEFLKDKDRKEIKEIFDKNLTGNVNIMLFTDTQDKCQYCKETLELLTEVSKLSDKIKLTVYDVNINKREAAFLGIERTPAIVIGGAKIYNVFYFGIPAGHEFSALLEDIMDASNNRTRLAESTKSALKGIKGKLDIKVFVTPTCPWCPRAVRTAHQFAMENSNIRSSMIESMEFPEYAEKYAVMAVPKVVINDDVSFEGALPEPQFLEYVLEAAKKA